MISAAAYRRIHNRKMNNMNIELTISGQDLDDYIEQQLEDKINALDFLTTEDLTEHVTHAELKDLVEETILQVQKEAFNRGHTAGYEEGYKAGFSRGLNKGYESQAKNFEQI